MKLKIQTGLNLLLIILMPFMWYIDIADTKVNFALADVLLVFAAILVLFNLKEVFTQKRWLILLYFGGLLFSLALSQYAGKFNTDFLHVPNTVMLMEMVKTAVVAMYFISAFLFINEKYFKLTMVTISLGSIPVMAVGFAAYIFRLLDRDFPIETYALDRLRFRGTFEDPNLCALYFIIVFFVSLYCFKVVRNAVLRCLVAGVGLVSLISIVLTQSRGGWLALAGAVVIFLILNMKYIRKESILFILPVALFLMFVIEIDYRYIDGKVTDEVISRVQVSINQDVEDIDRVQLTKTAFQMGNDNFLTGVGKGSFPLNTNKYLGDESAAYKSQHIPHNTLFGFYAQQGIIGLLLFILLPGYILFLMVKNWKRQNAYFLALFTGILLHSMTINIENVRFVWFILGILLASEVKRLQPEFAPETTLKKGHYALALGGMLCLFLVLYGSLSIKMATNIYIAKGKVYEKTISSLEPGEYSFSFELQTDGHLHTVEVYDGQELVKKMDFKSAYGLVQETIPVKDNISIRFVSNNEGWMRVNNAYLQNQNMKMPVYDYILLPESTQNWIGKKQLLTYHEEPTFRKEPNISGSPLQALALLNTRVTRYSNLTHVIEVQYRCDDTVDKNYQLDLLMDYASLSFQLPEETQRNSWSHRFTLSPTTTKWEKGKEYNTKTYKLYSSDDFQLFGRYYDYENKVFEQEAYFPITWQMAFEGQDILPLGESAWINKRYTKDEENIIHMTFNAWVETGRYNLEPGDHTLTFTAKGSNLEGFSEVRLRDSHLNKISTITLDDTMKEYTVDYHTDTYQEGVSFILELINYKSEKDVGNRKVLLKDTLIVR